MVLDSSAIVALVWDEPESPRLQRASVTIVGVPTLLESSMVLTRLLRSAGRTCATDLLIASEVEVIPFTSEHNAVAYQAFLRFGKGRHPAALNFGDCMAYAVAKVARQPLLFVGSDFSQTDLEVAG